MEVVVIGADNSIGTREVDNDFGIMDLIGGGIMEIVRPMGLRGTGLVMIVDDNGIAKGFAENRAAGALYRGMIVGDAVICPEVTGPDGPELAGFREGMARKFMEQIMEKAPYLRSGNAEAEKPDEREFSDALYLLAEHPRRSAAGFQPKAKIPESFSCVTDTVLPGYVLRFSWDSRSPDPKDAEPNPFAVRLGAPMIYGDCILAKYDRQGMPSEMVPMEELEGVMEKLGYGREQWLDREAFGIYRDFTCPAVRPQVLMTPARDKAGKSHETGRAGR